MFIEKLKKLYLILLFCIGKILLFFFLFVPQKHTDAQMHLFCSDLFYFGAVGDKSLVKFRNWLKFGGFRNPQFGFLLLCSKHIKLIFAFLFDFAISTTLTTRKGLFTPRLPALICRDVLVALCVGQRLLLWFSGDRTTEENQWAFFPAYLPAQNQHVNEAFSHWGLLRCAFCVAQRWLIPVVLAALANGRWWAQQASVWKGLSRVGQRRTQQAASLGTKGLDNNPKPRRVFTTRRSFNQLEIFWFSCTSPLFSCCWGTSPVSGVRGVSG